MTLSTRGRTGRRPRRDVARASAGISLRRVLAAAVMFACAGGLFAATNAPQFGVARGAVMITGAHYTSADALLAAVGIPRDAEVNAFRIRTDDIALALTALPPVLHADVAVALPNRVLVRVTERTPILVWQTPRGRFLVDVEGLIFAAAPAGDVPAPGAPRSSSSPAAPPTPIPTRAGSPAAAASSAGTPSASRAPSAQQSASPRASSAVQPTSSARPAPSGTGASPGATASATPATAVPTAGGPDSSAPETLPVIHDSRSGAERLAVGSRLDRVDLDVIRQLGAVTPAMLGSRAASVAVTIDDTRGYAIETAPPSWVAVFGIYTPTLRGPDAIPAQVQCLRALIADREADLQTVFLFPAERRCGTFAARPTPAPTASPSPTPRASRRP